MIDAELTKLNTNVGMLADKTANEMARSVYDMYDYSSTLYKASAITEGYSAMANMVGLVSFAKSMYDLPGQLSTLGKKGMDLYKLGSAQLTKMLNGRNLMTAAKSSLQIMCRGDFKWTYDFAIADLTWWSKKYEDVCTAGGTLADAWRMGDKFQAYTGVMNEAVERLRTVSDLLNQALNTVSTSEAAELEARARAELAKAEALIAQANEIKNEGNGLLAEIERNISLNGSYISAAELGAIRMQAMNYIETAESTVRPYLLSIHTRVAQIEGIREFEKQATLLKNSAADMKEVLAGDETFGADAARMADTTANLLKDMGYDVNASLLTRLTTLRGKNKVLAAALFATVLSFVLYWLQSQPLPLLWAGLTFLLYLA
ncbi:MAG: hypothetical protein EOM58_12370, partial [Clostridia bacterium]|nr:hypothetical protein [Clostridia bacterium]